MAAPVNRWFVRCVTCLAMAAVDEHPNTHEWRCGVCQGPIENMGRVERERLIHEHLEAICDDRCTNAKGPICNCKCGGQHHGSHRVVRVVRDAGPVPTVTPSTGRDQARLNADEYGRYRAAALALLDPLLASKRRGYLPAGEYDRMRMLQAALRKAHEARVHLTRVRTLLAVAGHLPAPTANPIAAVAHETHAAIAAATPLADTPFTLDSTTAPTRAPRQDSLF
jgi:hypothetical protein